MIIIVDTNIVFSAILNIDSHIGSMLLNTGNYFQYYSVDQLKNEIIRHKSKIIKLTNFSDNEFQEVYEIVTRKIQFIRDSLIPERYLLKAEGLLSDIDIDDTVFVALAIHLKAKLWTGDKALYNGLKKKKFNNLVTTDELFKKYISYKTR